MSKRSALVSRGCEVLGFSAQQLERVELSAQLLTDGMKSSTSSGRISEKRALPVPLSLLADLYPLDKLTLAPLERHQLFTYL